MYFTVTLYAVLIMFIVGAIGFTLKKANLISEHASKDLSKILVYVCQPALIWYSFDKCRFTTSSLLNIGITFVSVAVIMCLVIFVFYCIFKKKYENVDYRIYTICAAMSNYAFFGIPVLTAVFPDKISDLMVLSATAAVVLNLIGWSLACFVITGDKKYVSLKKILFNPSLLILIVVLPLFFCNVHLSGNQNEFLSLLGDMIELVGRTATTVFMLVLGMRLASSDLKGIFCNYRLYLICFFKQVILPLIVFAVFYFMPVAVELKQTLFVLFSCPIASVALNYAEMVGKGQNTAANTVLLSVASSVITLPVITLLLNTF